MDINIITVNGYFGQSLPSEMSLNLAELRSGLESYGFKTNLIDIQELQFSTLDEDAIYLIGSHQNADVKKYIDDCLSVFFRKENSPRLIPSRINVLAHDNKGVQAILTQQFVGSDFPKQGYFYRSSDIHHKTVVKAPAGAGSAGVDLVSSKKELEKTLKRFSLYEYNIKNIVFNIKDFIKKNLLRSRFSKAFTDYHKKYTLYCLQDFYEGLACDFKVLVFGSTVYVLERKVRAGSFKASGSGMFSYPEPDNDLLTFSYELRKKLDSPYVSLDVVKLKDGSFKCIEFQCVHFGPYTQINAEHKFVRMSDGEWIKQDNDLTLEAVYAQAINEFIQ